MYNTFHRLSLRRALKYTCEKRKWSPKKLLETVNPCYIAPRWKAVYDSTEEELFHCVFFTEIINYQSCLCIAGRMFSYPLFKYARGKYPTSRTWIGHNRRVISKVEIIGRPIFSKESFSIFDCFLAFPTCVLVECQIKKLMIGNCENIVKTQFRLTRVPIQIVKFTNPSINFIKLNKILSI